MIIDISYARLFDLKSILRNIKTNIKLNIKINN